MGQIFRLSESDKICDVNRIFASVLWLSS